MMKEVHGGNIYKFSHKIYDFSANLNPLGMPKEVKQAIVDHIDQYESYPDPFNRELISEISRFHHVPSDRICCGNGAADVIFRIGLGLKPKKALIVSPTFSEYEEAMDVAGCQVTHYLMKEENNFTITEEIFDYITDDIEMMFICNPNNPTGIPVDRSVMLNIAEACKKIGAILVIDECFSEFIEGEERFSVMDEITSLNNVIILKAFTKIYAMAGLRLGYCICGDVSVAEKINDTLQPWSVSTVASKAGVAALKLEGFIEQTKVYISENRRFLVEGLKRLGYDVYDTEANYIFFRSEQDLIAPLLQHDIMIRSCANYITLDEHYYRIAVRTREENEYLLQCLGKLSQ
ncbi:threonine-phosphate decarboxylase [Clostridiales Family XIII bacterium PM5-7]